jgi:hypothetical protein
MALHVRIGRLLLPPLVVLLVLGHMCGLAGEALGRLLPIGTQVGADRADHRSAHDSHDEAGHAAHGLTCETAVAQQGQTGPEGPFVLDHGSASLNHKDPVVAWPRVTRAAEPPHRSPPLYLRYRSLLI